MRIVLQRVSSASVTIDGEVTGEIGTGFCLLAGYAPDDTPEVVSWLA
jgi:D-tyrosyl-tRNA(Tyr) deacylase